jgi:hypothetical protein
VLLERQTPATSRLPSPLRLTEGLFLQVHLQSVRASDPNSKALLVRLQHLYATGEDTNLSQAVTVDLDAFLVSAGLEHASTAEVTLDGMRAVETTCTRTRYPVDEPDTEDDRRCASVQSAAAPLELKPFDIRTFRVTTA